MAAVWPRGMPSRDRLIFEGLLPAERSKVIARLDAVRRAEAGEPLAPLAAAVGLSRAAFYNLRSAFRERSLEGLVPNIRRAPRRTRDPAGSSVRTFARALLVERGLEMRNVDLARLLLERAHPGPEIGGETDQTRLQWAERLVRHERRAIALDPVFLRANFGRRILVDVTAVSVFLPGDDELAVVSVCLDAASGLVLGSMLGRIDNAVELERAAVDEAHRFVRRNRADRAVPEWPPTDLRLMLPPSAQGPGDDGELRAAAGRFEVRFPGTYAYGSELVQLTGPRIGRLPLAPRRTLGISRETFGRSRHVVALGADQADAYWKAEVARHNEPVREAITRAGIFDSGVPEGRIAQLTYALDGYLLSFDPPR